jgi:hypothetical protein
LSAFKTRQNLEKLPQAEREAFTQLWADVAALLKKADPSPKENSK